MTGQSTGITKSQRFNFIVGFRIIFRSSYKRILVFFLVGLFFFFSIGFIFSLGVSYERVNFVDYSSTADWYNDQQVSAYYSTLSPDFVPEFTYSYLDNAICEISDLLNSNIPEIASTDFTGLMSIELFHFNGTNFIHHTLNVFDTENNAILPTHLTAGRMPTSPTELLFYNTSNPTHNFSINETISLLGQSSIGSLECNFTIVGIVADLNSTNSAINYSRDVIDWSKNIDDYRYLFSSESQFYTTGDYFFNITNLFPILNGGRAVMIDFDYNLAAIDVSYLNIYLRNLISIDSDSQFTSELDELYSIGLDLHSFLQIFNRFWFLELFLLIVISMPFLYLLLFFNVETFNRNKQEIFSLTKTLKSHGVANNSIRNVFFLESFLLLSFATVIGLLIGFISGNLLGLRSSITSLKFKFIFSSFYQPLFQIILPTLYFGFLLMYFFGYNKTIKQITFRESESNKFNKKKTAGKFFSLVDLLLLFFAFSCLGIGILLFLLFPSNNSNLFVTSYDTPLILYEMASRSLIYLGSIFSVVLFFNLLSKGMITTIAFIGKKTWLKSKTKFTLSLFSIYKNRDIYLKVITLAMISGLSLIPCFFAKKSITNHILLESNLATAGSELVVDNWSNDGLLLEKIENLTGVEHTSVITLNMMNLKLTVDSNEIFNYIKLLAIHNITSFIQLLDSSSLILKNVNTEDLTALTTNLSCLTNTDFAKDLKLKKGSAFSNILLGDVTEELSLLFIDAFDYFPMLYFDEESQTESQTIHLVTNLPTATQLLSTTSPSMFSNESKLLIRVSKNTNTTVLKNRLISDFGLSVYTKNEIQMVQESRINTFILDLFIILGTFVVVLEVLFGFVLGRTIYYKNLHAIEATIRIGVNKRQIIKSFITEIFVTISLPVLISLFVCYQVLRIFISNSMNVQQIYHTFKVWFPGWLILLLFLIWIMALASGWLSGIIPSLRTYKPTKQE